MEGRTGQAEPIHLLPFPLQLIDGRALGFEIMATVNEYPSGTDPTPRDATDANVILEHRGHATWVAGFRSALRKLGPGLVTGASDDDPSGIATYSQVGAQFGYGMLWTMLVSYPLMGAIQEICARVGRVTGSGIAANLRKCYPVWLLYLVVTLMLVANVFNLGADIGAVGAAAQLLVPGRTWLYVLLFGVASLLLQMFVPYSSYVKYLKWLTLSLFAYVAAAFYVQLSWRQVLHATIFPHLTWSTEYLTGLVAVLGTTISPYLFFWQASQEVEEVKNHHGEKALRRAPRQAATQLGRIRWDTYFGMALSNLVAFFIILTTAATLHAHGETQVATAAQAARALAPLAGHWAAGLFACGIIGTGMLAIPVLAGSAAYAVGEACKWRSSLENKPEQAPGFYLTIALATLVGVFFNFWHVDPVRALFWAAVLNGVIAAPMMAVIVHLATSRKVMGKFAIPLYLRVVGWIATLAMFGVSVGVFLARN
jgi:NRAMP (natural resistance-associated macrophage protein)-like metal ion transporter